MLGHSRQLSFPSTVHRKPVFDTGPRFGFDDGDEGNVQYPRYCRKKGFIFDNLFGALKRDGVSPKNTEAFVDALDCSVVNSPLHRLRR